jgi:hypothetical protein
MTALSDSAISRLQGALNTWKEGNSFLYHLSTEPDGQDQVFVEALDRLNEVAHAVDESYRSWWDLERELDRDYRNLRAYIEQALEQPATA